VDEEVIQKLEMTILSSLHFSSIQSNIGGGKSGKVSSFSISYPHGGYGQERREGGEGNTLERERDDQMQHRWMGWTGILLLLVLNGFSGALHSSIVSDSHVEVDTVLCPSGRGKAKKTDAPVVNGWGRRTSLSTNGLGLDEVISNASTVSGC
jgi:hypothetical protein